MKYIFGKSKTTLCTTRLSDGPSTMSRRNCSPLWSKFLTNVTKYEWELGTRVKGIQLQLWTIRYAIYGALRREMDFDRVIVVCINRRATSEWKQPYLQQTSSANPTMLCSVSITYIHNYLLIRFDCNMWLFQNAEQLSLYIEESWWIAIMNIMLK